MLKVQVYPLRTSVRPAGSATSHTASARGAFTLVDRLSGSPSHAVSDEVSPAVAA
jgi:hypothetical protein